MGRAFALPGALFVGLALAAMVAGCGGRRYRAGYTATATVSTPQMAVVGDGVWAVTDYDDPVFYSDDYYWRYDNGHWYRSNYLGGWNQVGVSVVPPRIRSIDRPRRYRRWSPRRQVRVRPVPQRHYRPHVRRADDTRVRRPPAARRGRVVRPGPRSQQRRGARIERRQDRRLERRQDRRERRLERREDRRDRRQDRREARRRGPRR